LAGVFGIFLQGCLLQVRGLRDGRVVFGEEARIPDGRRVPSLSGGRTRELNRGGADQ